MKQRLIFLVRLYITLLLIFVTQEAIFMIFNQAYADGAPFGSCLAALLHGLKLDSVAACYILIVPLLVVTVSCFFKQFPLRKLLMPYYLIAALLMTVIFLADAILYHFWGAKLDAADLIYAANPKDVLVNLAWWMLLLALLLLGLLTYHYCRRLRHTTPERLTPLRSRWSSLMALPLAALLLFGMRGSVSESTANPSYAYFSQYQFCNHADLNPFFNMMHSLFKAQDLAHEFDMLPPEEAAALVEPCFETTMEVTDTLLAVPNPDILLVVWEGGGWQMTMSDSVAPNLMRYGREGVLFSNCYANSFRTDRGLVSLLSGWMALPTTSLMKMNDKCQRLPGLAHELRQAGYSTRFVYGGDIDFTNMRGYLHETGFETVVGSESFGDTRRLGAWGAPDAYTMLPSLVEPATPSLTAILTLSSHEPWTVPMQRLDDERYNSFAYTDSCLAVLLDSLKASPRWDNLLVIIVPDHGIPANASQSTADPLVARIPIVWTGGAIGQPCVIDCLMSQSDLVMTLLAQLLTLNPNMEHLISAPQRFPFSRNVLSPEYSSNFQFAMHAFKNGCNLFDSAGVARFDCPDRSVSHLEGELSPAKERFFRALIQLAYYRSGSL